MTAAEYGPGQVPLYQVECGACQWATESQLDVGAAMCAWMIHVVDEHWDLVETLHETQGRADRGRRLAELIQGLRG